MQKNKRTNRIRPHAYTQRTGGTPRTRSTATGDGAGPNLAYGRPSAHHALHATRTSHSHRSRDVCRTCPCTYNSPAYFTKKSVFFYAKTHVCCIAFLFKFSLKASKFNGTPLFHPNRRLNKVNFASHLSGECLLQVNYNLYQP